MSFHQSLAPLEMEKWTFHQYFFPEMAAHDISCPVALPEDMSKFTYFDQAEVDGYVNANYSRFRPRTSNSSLLYQPCINSKEIRVLEIHPASFHADIECTLRHCFIDFEYSVHHSTSKLSWQGYSHGISLEGAPLWYTALSYAWGRPDFKSVIKCNGFDKHITPDLEAAIRHLRKDTTKVIVWIDQVCINQDDLGEKAQQVQLMGLIYQRAFSTIIWLGKDPVQRGVEILQRVHEQWKFSAHQVSDGQLDAFIFPQSKAEVWQHLNDLLSRPWFRRLWIIQEVALSKRLCVMSGAYLVPWRQLSTPCATADDSGFIERLERQVLAAQTSSPSISTICRTVVELSSIGDYLLSQEALPSLFSTLVQTRYAEASNPSDKIYGTLGICQSNIMVDYSLSAAQVFYDATLSMLEEAHRLYKHLMPKLNFNARCFSDSLYAILSCVDHEPEPNIRPSWVPDWARPRQTNALRHNTFALNVYAAGQLQQTFANNLLQPLFKHGERKLTVFGHVHDSLTGIVSTGDVVDLTNKPDAVAKSRLAVFADLARTKCHAYSSSTVEGDLFSAFWRTMVAGRDGSGREKCPSSYEEIFSLLLDTATGKQPSLPGQVYSQRRLKGFMNLDSLGVRNLGRTFADLRKAYASAMKSRAVCATVKGHFGLVPAYSAQGDVICVLAGYPVPFVLRDLGDGTFHLIGECYLHGIMSGELEGTAVYRELIFV